MRQAGIDLPRTSYAQFGMGTPSSRGAVQAGDLVFFSTDGPGASHVGIATGPGRRSPRPRTASWSTRRPSGYWGAHYLGARRWAEPALRPAGPPRSGAAVRQAHEAAPLTAATARTDGHAPIRLASGCEPPKPPR